MRRPYVIAEIGSNHDGELTRAHSLIALAQDSGADAVKFQYFTADSLVSRRGLPDSALATLRQNQMPAAWLPWLAADAAERGLGFIVSTFDPKDVELVNRYTDIHKVASFELLDNELLREIEGTGKQVILSTGMADNPEIHHAVDMFPSYQMFALLHCVSSYPAPVGEANVRAVKTLKREYPHLRIGLSDHTIGPTAAIVAVTLGAAVIEKHFDDDNDREGPDHGPFAMEAREFTWMAKSLHEVPAVLARTGNLGSEDAEQSVMPYRVRRP